METDVKKIKQEHTVADIVCANRNSPELLAIWCTACCYPAYGSTHSRLKGVGEGYP